MDTDLVEIQTTTPAILQRAIELGASAEALEKISNTIEQARRWDAERLFNEAMNDCQRELPTVVKNAYNQQTKSPYAQLDAIGDAIDPIIVKHGFAPSYGTEDSPIAGHVRIVCDLRHRGGHCVRYHLDLPPDAVGIQGTKNKTPIHAICSSFSYGCRYLTVGIFKVRLRNQDNDAQQQIEDTIISAADARALEVLLMEANADITAFCKLYRVTTVAELPKSQLAVARGQIRRKMELAKHHA